MILGLALGWGAVQLFNINGFYIGNMGLSGFLVGDTIRAQLMLDDILNLSAMTFIVTLLAGLYPAVTASRMEPVAALRAEK